MDFYNAEETFGFVSRKLTLDSGALKIKGTGFYVNSVFCDENATSAEAEELFEAVEMYPTFDTSKSALLEQQDAIKKVLAELDTTLEPKEAAQELALGTVLIPGGKYLHAGEVYEYIQPASAVYLDTNWSPENAPALWEKVADQAQPEASEEPRYAQWQADDPPGSANWKRYPVGAIVWFGSEDTLWINQNPNNTYQPGVAGWVRYTKTSKEV